MKIKFIIFFNLLFLASNSSSAQNPQWLVYTLQNSGLPSNMVGSISIDTNNNKWIGTDSGIVKFDGINWIVYNIYNSPLPENAAGVKAIDRYNHCWISTGHKGLIKFDGLNSWTIYDTNNSGIPSNHISGIAIDKNDVKWVGTTNRGLGKFYDTAWVVYNKTNSGLPSNIIWTVAAEDSIIWIGHHTFVDDAGLTKFDGTNWVIYNVSNSGLPSNIVIDITIDSWGNKWLATQFGGLAKFNSSLNQWTVYNTHNSGLPANNLYTVLTDNAKKWIGTQGAGLAFYNDTSWLVYDPENSPLPGYVVFNLGLDSLNNLWICTDGGLAEYNPNGIIGISKIQTYLPKNFTLYQNYPNPFNSSTNIKYQISKSGHIKIIIYDMLGEVIATLVNSYQRMGIYEIIFENNYLPSGVYFYSLETSDYFESKKMVLIK